MGATKGRVSLAMLANCVENPAKRASTIRHVEKNMGYTKDKWPVILRNKLEASSSGSASLKGS